jgi:hypothetical protein
MVDAALLLQCCELGPDRLRVGGDWRLLAAVRDWVGHHPVQGVLQAAGLLQQVST